MTSGTYKQHATALYRFVRDWPDKGEFATTVAAEEHPSALPTTSSRLRELSTWMIVLGLIVGLGAFAILQLSQDKISAARINGESDQYAGEVTLWWISTAVGLLTAAIGAALLFLNPKGGQTTKVQSLGNPPASSSIGDRLALAQSLLDQGLITDDEYRDQRKRILSEA